MFWGGERLKRELPSLVSDFDPRRLDPASYRLRVGREIYVSPTGEAHDPRDKPKTLLEPGQGFTIPAGQFGFVLTEDTVRVPLQAMALISIRSNYKFQGLVNVSGFHVDPAFEGHLLFSVFNAGQRPVHLAQGEECFLIWYASLDQPSEVPSRTGYASIPSQLTGPLATGLQSFAGLDAKIRANDEKVGQRMSAIEKEHAVLKWAAGLALGILITLAVRQWSTIPASDRTPAAVTSPSTTANPLAAPSPLPPPATDPLLSGPPTQRAR